MATTAEQLILRGLHILMRSNFAPSDPVIQANHFAKVTADLGPWFTDYASEIAKPAVDFTLERIDEPTRDHHIADFLTGDPPPLTGHKSFCTKDRCYCGPQ